LSAPKEREIPRFARNDKNVGTAKKNDKNAGNFFRKLSTPTEILNAKGRTAYKSSRMELTQNVAAWLGWLSRVRFFLISLLFALVLVLGRPASLKFHPLFSFP
jgi:hypothetical protein